MLPGHYCISSHTSHVEVLRRPTDYLSSLTFDLEDWCNRSRVGAAVTGKHYDVFRRSLPRYRVASIGGLTRFPAAVADLVATAVLRKARTRRRFHWAGAVPHGFSMTARACRRSNAERNGPGSPKIRFQSRAPSGLDDLAWD